MFKIIFKENCNYFVKRQKENINLPLSEKSKSTLTEEYYAFLDVQNSIAQQLTLYALAVSEKKFN